MSASASAPATGPLATPIVRACAVTDPGLVRPTNEDAFVVAELASGRRWSGGEPARWPAERSGVLLAVSDGMGGERAGEVASALSVETVLAGMVEEARGGRPDVEGLRRVVERASKVVYEDSKRPERRGMGATFTAVLVVGAAAHVAQIGDSRAYLLHDGRLTQVTRDQSYVQMLVDAGVMSPEEAERSPRRNVILQVMGQEAVRVATRRIELTRGDRLLLCSDGLSNVVESAAIEAIARPPSDLAGACQTLVSRAKQSGAPDNVTVVLADVA